MAFRWILSNSRRMGSAIGHHLLRWRNTLLLERVQAGTRAQPASDGHPPKKRAHRANTLRIDSQQMSHFVGKIFWLMMQVLRIGCWLLKFGTGHGLQQFLPDVVDLHRCRVIFAVGWGRCCCDIYSSYSAEAMDRAPKDLKVATVGQRSVCESVGKKRTKNELTFFKDMDVNRMFEINQGWDFQ